MKILKSIGVLFCSIMIPYLVSGQGLEFEEGTWNEIKKLAKASDKLIFFDANTSWCGPCKWMVKNTFTDEKVGKFYKENFISYELDMEKGEGIELAKEFEIKAYPTLLFLNSDGEIVHRTTGALDAEKFLALGKIAADPEKNFAGMVKRYKNGDRSRPFIREYMSSQKEAGKSVQEVLDWYFYQLPDSELLTKENFEVINKHVNRSGHPQFVFLLENREAYENITSEKEVNDKIYNVYRSSLFNALYSNDSLQWEMKKSEVKASSIDDPDKLLAYADIYYFSRKKDWTSYVKVVDHYVTTYDTGNWQSLNAYAWQVYKNKNITDKSSLKLALSWVNRSIKLKTCYANNDTKAALLHKMGDNKGALKAATKAISIAEPSENTSETKKLISLISMQ
ncbi:thioredoxin family protein [Fulvivirga sp. M361]|uniref:thioredoxin family protein n=1 Tax=Fulvivirga sp. M361 TaxID=2594266 RepID=UPI00117ABCF6|nr:thioredoxin family protein [Fulvivirga sp. M361]TRX60176.1 thioredoxin family protein [Fulvivirga sp. M361]